MASTIDDGQSRPISWQGTDRRRLSPRLIAEIDVRYGRAGNMSAARGIDLSTNGIGFAGAKLFPVGSALQIEFRLNLPQAEWFRFGGIVRHVGRERMGVEFQNLADVDKARILQVIDHELALRRPG